MKSSDDNKAKFNNNYFMLMYHLFKIFPKLYNPTLCIEFLENIWFWDTKASFLLDNILKSS